MNTTNKAQSLILIHNKMWLSEKLGISRVTLDNRLKLHNWKISEKHLINTLQK